MFEELDLKIGAKGGNKPTSTTKPSVICTNNPKCYVPSEPCGSSEIVCD
jgi:hypothetical protein